MLSLNLKSGLIYRNAIVNFIAQSINELGGESRLMASTCAEEPETWLFWQTPAMTAPRNSCHMLDDQLDGVLTCYKEV
jgi:hypothetical protein